MDKELVASELLKVAKDLTGSDDKNPNLMFQTLDGSLLRQIASGRIDAQKYARQEMANRGLGKNGRWVGFEQAAKEWRV